MVKFLAYAFLGIVLQSLVSLNNSHGTIGEYIELSVLFSTDTIYSDSTFILTVVFKNKTESNVVFYPKAILSIVRFTGTFSFDSYFLNDYLDLRNQIDLAPFETHKLIYEVRAKPPVFRKGPNNLYVYYIAKELRGDLKKYNKLFGSLTSDKFEIYVK